MEFTHPNFSVDVKVETTEGPLWSPEAWFVFQQDALDFALLESQKTPSFSFRVNPMINPHLP